MLLTVTVAWLLAQPALPCTALRVTGPEGTVVAKNLDWSTERGLLLLNPRGMRKTALTTSPGDLPAIWTSRYASLTFNQVGREFPYGGMNERGLVVETLWLEGSQTPPVGSPGPSINGAQWVQFQLDQAATVSEAIALSKSTRVEPAFARVHYFACDASGECAVFEYLKGELSIHTGADLPIAVLANGAFADSYATLAQYAPFGGTLPIPLGEKSSERFVRAASLVARYDGNESGEVFARNALWGVRTKETRWSIVYLPARGEIVFSTRKNSVTRRIGFLGQDLRCDAGVRAAEFHNPRPWDSMKKLSIWRNSRLIYGDNFLSWKLRAKAAYYPSRHTKCE